MSTKGRRPQIPIVPDPAATAPPSVVPIVLDNPTKTPVPRVRMPEDTPQRAPATPPAVQAAAAPVIHAASEAPAPKRSNFAFVVLGLALVVGLGSVALGVFAMLLGGALVLSF